MSARDTQIGGDHYRKHAIQPLDIIDEYGLSFRCGNAIKYILRDKNPDKRVEDLQKARHYIEMEIERLLTPPTSVKARDQYELPLRPER